MLALEPTVVDAIWQSFAAYLPERGETTHPLGCRRPRISDRDCFEAILFRLVTGCSWDVAGRLGRGSETTLRRRRDEWVAIGACSSIWCHNRNGAAPPARGRRVATWPRWARIWAPRSGVSRPW